MEWINQNWFWLLIGIVFVGMHLFGHGGRGGGCCGGGHGEPRPSDKDEKKPQTPAGHQH